MYKLFIVMLLIPNIAFAEVDLAQALFGAFRSGCKSIGPLTIEATSQAYSIRNLIEAIRNDDECKDWANSVEALNASLVSLKSPPGFENIDTISSKITELGDMIAIETNPVARAELAIELAQLKVDSLYFGQNSNERLWANRIDRMDRTNYMLNAFNSSIRSNTKCMNKYPGVFFELGGQVLQAAGSQNVWGSAAGAGLMGVGTILNFLIDMVKGNIFARTLKKLKTTTLTNAYMCALETVSSTYCSAKETGERITLAVDNDITIFSQKWEGLSIMENIFHFNNWMSRVISGTPSGSIATANLKKEVIELRSVYQKDVEEINALIRESETEIFNSAPENHEDIILQLIGSLVKKIKPKDDELRKSPYGNSFIKNPRCGPLFFIFSPEGDRNPNIPPFKSCKNYIFNELKLPTPSLSHIKAKISTILEEGKTYVDFRFSIVKETDPELILLEGEKPSRFDRPSPIELLKKIKIYLSDTSIRLVNNIPAHTGYTINQTLDKIEKTLSILSHPIDQMDEPFLRIKKKAAIKLDQIQKLIAPDMKDNYLGERLRQIVNIEIKYRLKNEGLPETFEELLFLTIGDEITNLERFTSFNLETKRYDIAGAMRSSLINLESLGNVFKWKLERMFKDLLKDSVRYPGETSTEITLNRLCAVSLSLPQINKMKKIKKYCAGRRLSAIYSPKEIFIDFNEKVKGPFPDRACSYFDYLRKNEIYQRFGRSSTRRAN
ncbi:MAG: hypothetical protein DRQ88_08475 [Epsilonproteobacteria bacterium]|nr:MAG: hypothetical protein DRQ88_08475 [Campylobacterota bacterium]